MTEQTARRVTANLSLTLDGRYHGPGGPTDLGAIVRYAATDVARDQLARIHGSATTAVLGRGNAQGFLGWWGPVADDQDADPRDRGYARWLVGAEKVVFSRTITEPPWERTRMVDGPAAEVIADLRTTAGGDILVNTGPSVLAPLLAADLVDRLYLMICPEIVGAGARLFDDGLPATTWALTHRETGELGEIAATYDRLRD